MKRRKSVEAELVKPGKRVVFRVFNRTHVGDVMEVVEAKVMNIVTRNGLHMTLPLNSVEKIIGEKYHGDEHRG